MGVCRSVLQDVQDAEDAFQATFLVLAQKSTRICRPELLGNWLYGVAYRTAKKARRSKPKPILMPAMEPEAPRPEPDLAWKEVRMILDEELHRLPVRDRLLLTLCYFQGLTHQQVARYLDWRPGSVSRRLTKARHALRVGLQRRGVQFSAGALLVLLVQAKTTSALSPALVHSTSLAAVAAGTGCPLDTVASPMFTAFTRMPLRILSSLLAVLFPFLLFLGPCGITQEVGGAATHVSANDAGDLPSGAAAIFTSASQQQSAATGHGQTSDRPNAGGHCHASH